MKVPAPGKTVAAPGKAKDIVPGKPAVKVIAPVPTVPVPIAAPIIIKVPAPGKGTAPEGYMTPSAPPVSSYEMPEYVVNTTPEPVMATDAEPVRPPVLDSRMVLALAAGAFLVYLLTRD